MQQLAVVLAISAIAVNLLIRILLQQTRRRSLIAKTGCQPIVQYPKDLSRTYDQEKKESLLAGRFNEYAMERYQVCGSSTFKISTFTEQAIFTTEPSNRQTLATKQDDWHKESRRGGRPFLGKGIMDENGATWRHTRDLVNPLFKRAELENAETFEKYVARMIDLIPRDGRSFDMQPLVRKLFMDNSSEFVFGRSLDTLRDNTGKSDEFIAAFNRATTEAGKRIHPTGLVTKLYSFGTLDKAWLADCKTVHDYVDQCITMFRSQKSAKDAAAQRKGYVLIEGMSEAIADPIELRFQLLNIFFLARETSAMAFSNTMFLLARNPNIWAELRAQVSSLEDKDMTFENLRNLQHFRNTVHEAMRLHSPITRTRRLATRDTVLPRGGGPDGSSPAFVPKNTMVWSDTFPNTRDSKIWGEDVDTFRPSRFEGRKLGWEFTPFGGGPRVCPASQQVIMQCVYTLVRLVREFESIENRDPCLEFVEGLQMCFESKNGCKIALHPASASG